MTEAAHQIASNPLPPGNRKPGSVGFATGCQAAILDKDGNPVPAGQIGEVAIRGQNVIEAYKNNPAANDAAFANGWCRTGDQGVLDEEGYLSLTGRIKEIIDRGGEKVAPREIEDVLISHPGVQQVVVFPVPHPTLGEDIAAAVVPKNGKSLSEFELRDFALQRLSAYTHSDSGRDPNRTYRQSAKSRVGRQACPRVRSDVRAARQRLGATLRRRFRKCAPTRPGGPD